MPLQHILGPGDVTPLFFSLFNVLALALSCVDQERSSLAPLHSLADQQPRPTHRHDDTVKGIMVSYCL